MFGVLSGALEAVLDDFLEATPRKCKVVTDSPPYPFVWAFFAAMPCSLALAFASVCLQCCISFIDVLCCCAPLCCRLGVLSFRIARA
jgi:hypothetical protein